LRGRNARAGGVSEGATKRSEMQRRSDAATQRCSDGAMQRRRGVAVEDGTIAPPTPSLHHSLTSCVAASLPLRLSVSPSLRLSLPPLRRLVLMAGAYHRRGGRTTPTA